MFAFVLVGGGGGGGGGYNIAVIAIVNFKTILIDMKN